MEEAIWTAGTQPWKVLISARAHISIGIMSSSSICWLLAAPSLFPLFLNLAFTYDIPLHYFQQKRGVGGTNGRTDGHIAIPGQGTVFTAFYYTATGMMTFEQPTR